MLAAEAASSGWFLENAWLVPVVPAVAFALILLFGKRLGRPVGHGAYIGIASMATSLVLSAGAGAGHNRAAEAIREHAREEGIDAEWFDSLSFTGRVFRTLYAESYIWMASHSPALWGMLYKLMGKRTEQPNLRKLMKTYDSLNYRRLMRHIEEFRPDAVTCGTSPGGPYATRMSRVGCQMPRKKLSHLPPGP